MSTTPSVNSSTAATGTSSAAPASTAQAASDAGDRFLKLLVTQLQNQDPLNPMDNAQVTTQLAQISTVDGVNKLNTTLQTLLSSYASTQSLQSAAMIGHGVLVPGNQLNLQTGPVTAGVDLAKPADSVVVSILDASGSVVHKADLGPQSAGSVSFQWDGKKDDGTAAAPGAYTFSVNAQQGGSTVSADALSLGQVSSVTLTSSGAKLNVSGLGSVDLSQVKQIL
ncbi:MAG: flagellar hook assembly protein FlgD [Sulfuricellaceae bacterium]|nr:flagellar hook assembly protein FlgD [Sulfuricellaceae bacterium]